MTILYRILITLETVSKSYLKAHMLRLFREIERSGEGLIVTDNNRPVLQIMPMQSTKSVESLFANLMGQVSYSGNLNSPIS